MRKVHFILLVFLTGVLSCNSDNSDKRGEKYGGTLRINSTSVPDIIFPGHILKLSEQLIANQVYCGLMKYHPKTLDIIPSLASKHSIQDSGLVHIFTLHNNAFFHDDACFENGKGRKITSADVKYSIEQVVNIHLQSKHKLSGQLLNIIGVDEVANLKELKDEPNNISGIQTPNDTIIIFKLKTPDDMFLHFLASTNSMVFPKEAFQKYGTKSTVGSGAYCFKYSDIRGKAITLVANKNYFGTSRQGDKLPYIDTIINSFITSPPKEISYFEDNKLDLVYNVNTNYVTPFLEENIDKFQNNPPYFVLRQTVDGGNDLRYCILRANVKNIEINPAGYFDFTNVYFKEPVSQEVKVLN